MTPPTVLRRALTALTLVVVVCTVLLGAGSASAHTDFEYSLPTDGASVGEPVDEIVVAFTLPVTLVGNGFTVLDPQNNELAPFAVTDDDTVFRLQFDPPLAGGTVAVKYEVRAEDGHVLTGNFVFAVDAAVPTSAAPTTTTPPTTTVVPPSTGAPASAPTTTVAATTTQPAGTTTTPTTTIDDAVDASDDDGGGAGPYIAIAAAVVLGAAGFLLVRSRTSVST